MAVKIFISYSTEDSDKKDILKKEIQNKKGLTAIVVPDYRENGISFSQKVIDNLKDADYVIPILTARSYRKSQWLNQEIGYSFAILNRDKICPIAQRSIIKKLKGFIHNQAEVSYNYEGVFTNRNAENENFKKSVSELLDDILTKENLDSESGLRFNPVIRKDISAFKQSIDHKISSDLRLRIIVKLSQNNQYFRFYYRVVTDKREEFWVGFTNKKLPPGGRIVKGENTQEVKMESDLEYNAIDNVKSTVKERIKMMKGSVAEILGNPISLNFIQFRGDKQISDPIHYMYVFEDR